MDGVTVFLKTKSGVHDVEVSGKETMGSLYKKAARASGLLEGKFKLVWEGEVLDMNSGEEVQEIGLVEGCEVHVEVIMRTVGLKELRRENSEVVSELEGLVAADPELVLVVEVEGSDEYLSMAAGDLPSGLRGLVVTDSTGCVTAIDDEFLRGCDHLTSVHLSLPNVFSIGEAFMYQCKNLKSIDLSETNKVSSIGDSFLSWCEKLETIDLSSMANVYYVGDAFMYGCEKLETIDLSAMINLNYIGDVFMYKCDNLRIIDLSGSSDSFYEVLKNRIPEGISVNE